MELRPLQQYEPDTSGADVMDQHWPYNGSHSPKRTTDALDAVARLVRYLDNAISIRDGLGSAQDTYDALCELCGAVFGMEQLLRQLEHHCGQQLRDDESLRHDEHKSAGHLPAAETAEAAAARLAYAARPALKNLSSALDETRGHLAHLYHRPTPLAEEGIVDDDR